MHTRTPRKAAAGTTGAGAASLGAGMETARYRALLAAESAALAGAARGRLSFPVAHCPGWTVADMVQHAGLAQACVERAARGFGRRALALASAMPPSPGDELVEWFEEGAGRCVRSLKAAPGDVVMPTLWPAPGVSDLEYWHRHIVRETAVHRWDAELAAGTAPAALDAAAAADGFDDVVTNWLPHVAARGNQAQGPWAGQTFAFAGTDGPWRWWVRMDGPGAVTAGRGAADADVSVRAPAWELMLLAMNRISPYDLDVDGDAGLFERWRLDVRYGRKAGT
ncbi:MAG: maleylpyruvate isomerase N-terminal domain-containing protein [Actinobacteria bacterium]|nr:maleylpyruvate isomerase N-terminal domain-containing protein [Actinomycetota bacterium]